MDGIFLPLEKKHIKSQASISRLSIEMDPQNMPNESLTEIVQFLPLTNCQVIANMIQSANIVLKRDDAFQQLSTLLSPRINTIKKLLEDDGKHISSLEAVDKEISHLAFGCRITGGLIELDSTQQKFRQMWADKYRITKPMAVFLYVWCWESPEQAGRQKSVQMQDRLDVIEQFNEDYEKFLANGSPWPRSFYIPRRDREGMDELRSSLFAHVTGYG